MRHAHAVLCAGSGKTHKVFGTDVGSKDGCTDDIPRFAFAEEVVLTVGTFHLFLVFLDGTIDGIDDCKNANRQHCPVEPDKFI